MAFLSQFRVLTKILAVIGVMAANAIAIAFVGTTALSSLNDATDLMEQKAASALLAARLSRDAIALNRSEYMLVADLLLLTARKSAKPSTMI